MKLNNQIGSGNSAIEDEEENYLPQSINPNIPSWLRGSALEYFVLMERVFGKDGLITERKKSAK